jgi:hypothetical protein
MFCKILSFHCELKYFEAIGHMEAKLEPCPSVHHQGLCHEAWFTAGFLKCFELIFDMAASLITYGFLHFLLLLSLISLVCS